MEKIKCKAIFSEEEQKEIIRLYLLPESLSVIAKKFGLKNRNVIKKVLIENNIKLRTKEEIGRLNSQKTKATLQAKYGINNVFQLKAIKEKACQTKLNKYGDANYRNQEKIRQTCLERYGTTNGGWTIEAQEKIKQTNLEKFGCEWSIQAKHVKEKSKQTCIKKYGVEYPEQAKEVQSKMEQGMLKKYGVRRYAQTEEFHYKSQHKYLYNNETFDSFPESAYYVYCIDHNKVILRVPIRLSYSYEGNEHYYLPDFKVDNELIEIKGDQFFKEDNTMQCPFDHQYDGLAEAKHQCMIQNNVKILRSADYQQYIDYFNSKYDKDDFKIK